MSETICRRTCSQHSFLLFFALALLFLAGCVSPVIDPDGTARIAVESDGSISIGGQKESLREAPGTLKSLGATRSTLIIIVGRRNAPLRAMKMLYRELVRSGFPKVVLRKPLEASVSKE